MSDLTISEVEEVARGVAKKTLGPDFLGDVMVREVSDYEGLPALRVVLTVTPDAVRSEHGEAILDMSVDLQAALQARREERFAYVGYMTPAERDQGDDLEAA